MGGITIDPERAEVLVVRRAQDLDYHVAVVVESLGTEAAAERAARDLRDRMGVVDRQWMRRADAARVLGVGVKMVDKLRRAGVLRGRRVVRTNRAYVHRSDVEALVARRAAGG